MRFHRAEAGHPTDDPVLLALTDTQRRFKIPVELLDQLAYGTGMDIQDSADTGSSPADEPQVLYRTFDDLRLYCYRVASVVGLVCIRIFGYQRSRCRSAGGTSWSGVSAHQHHSRREGRRRHGPDLSSRRRSRPLQDCTFGVSPGGDSGAAALAAGGRSRSCPRILRRRRRTDAADRRRQPARAVGAGEQFTAGCWKKSRSASTTSSGKKIRLTVREKLTILGKGLVKRLAVMTERWTQSPKVAVVGGGLAGLAAGCALAESGFRVTLFERRPYLGGRASSYQHPGTGEVVDNCQHVLLGCCTNLIEFYQRIGVEDKIRWYERMTFLEPGGRASVIEPSALPAPLHTAPAFLRASCLNLSDKLAIAAGDGGVDSHRTARHGGIFSEVAAPPRADRTRHRTLLEDCPGQRAERRTRSYLGSLRRAGDARIVSEIPDSGTHGRAHGSPDRALQPGRRLHDGARRRGAVARRGGIVPG